MPEPPIVERATVPSTPEAPAVPTVVSGSLLGDLVVRDGVITPRQLQEALARQRATQPPRKLGQILIEERMTSEQRLHETVKAHGSEFKIGTALVLLDLVTPEQLDECLAHQKGTPGKRIGEIATLATAGGYGLVERGGSTAAAIAMTAYDAAAEEIH
jgi:hypothetical protein